MSEGTTGRRGGALVQFYRYAFGIGYERNVGGVERAVRYALGAVSVLAGIVVVAFPVLSGSLANVLLALVLVVTGAYLIYEARAQYCPVNHTIGRSTYRGD